MQQKKEVEAYLEQKVNPLLEELLSNLIKSRPKNVLNYCRNWLEKKADTAQVLSQQSDSSEDEDEAHVEELLAKRGKNKWYERRRGICGEVYGSHNLWEDYEMPVVNKKSTVNSRILFRIKSLFLFKEFDDGDINQLISTMTERSCVAGELVIREGESGQEMFVVDSGELEVMKGETCLKKVKEGEMFGEMSMLYNMPRWASIRSVTPCVLFELSRKSYHSLLNERNLRRRKLFQHALTTIDLFKELEPEERFKLQDLGKETPIHQNQYVIRESKHHRNFFIVESGKFVALRKEKSGHDKVVGHFKEGDVFGLGCLLSKNPPTDSVMSLTNGKLYAIDKDGLQRVLGPISNILKRSIHLFEKYKNYDDR